MEAFNTCSTETEVLGIISLFLCQCTMNKCKDKETVLKSTLSQRTVKTEQCWTARIKI